MSSISDFPCYTYIIILSVQEVAPLDPKINQYVYLQVESHDEEQSKQEYKARIADVTDHYYAIEIPINEQTGKLKRLYTGEFIYAYFISEGGVKNFFNTTVLGFREDGIKLVLIKKPDPELITKVQRRNYLRVPAELEVAVQVAGNIRMLGVTEDLSGGGLSFVCYSMHPLHAKDKLSCWLLMQFKNESIHHIKFECEVIRVKSLETDQQLVMASITNIHNVDRQKIIKYCFERQLELRKKMIGE